MANQLDPEYQRFFKNQRQDLPEGIEPFGTAPGHHPDSGWLRRQVTWKPNRPIQGAANWSEIWTDDDDKGTDYDVLPELNSTFRSKALPDAQLEYLKQERPGELWRNIQFFKKLKKGSFGTVWDVVAERRTDTKWQQPTLLQRVVDSGPRPWMQWKRIRLACKVMSSPYRRGSHWHDSVKTMLDDMHALRYLKHENIVQFHDIINIPDSKTGFPYAFVLILMDLCTDSLSSLLKKQRPDRCLSDSQTFAWLLQIASAVRYLHIDKRTVHLDIKPDNILYNSRKGQPIDQWIYKLCDFGMSISYNIINKDEPMMSAVKAGTMPYNPVEMYNNWFNLVPSMIDTSLCDIYALGSTVANSMLGKRFTSGENSYQQLISRLEEQKHGSRTRNFISLTLQMIDSDPQKRPNIEQVCNRLAEM